MFFPFPFGFSLVSAFLSPALLANASPYSLVERASDIIDFKLVGLSTLSSNRTVFDAVTLTPIDGHDRLFTVEGGWYGKDAMAAEITFNDFNTWAESNLSSILAIGNYANRYYVIVKDEPLTLVGLRESPDLELKIFPKVRLFRLPGKGRVAKKIVVVGGWYGENAIAKQLSVSEYIDLREERLDGVTDSEEGLLALGDDNSENRGLYAIYKEPESKQKPAKMV